MRTAGDSRVTTTSVRSSAMVGGTGKAREGGERGCMANAGEDSIPGHMGTGISISFSPLAHPRAQSSRGDPTPQGGWSTPTSHPRW